MAQSEGRSERELLRVIRDYWGYEQFRPLQAEAAQAVMQRQDSVLVLPTGGGKSLCFQAPAMCLNGLAVVISPLISLMKDQVDGLTSCGVPAACLNSSQTPGERRLVEETIQSGELKLLYISPERLNTDWMVQFLKQVPLSFFAIDEAHCISSWGHDFRPEYRALKGLRDQFPDVGIHSFTATATERVRQDIARELQLTNPRILVGNFDRPNLTYRVERRTNLLSQIKQVLQRHKGESGVIYCNRRADVEDLSASLTSAGHRALPYHAGLDDLTRMRNQEAFIQERAELIVATVAFGMGIDKSNVRFVIHAGAPKSLENYQQESGRAGRDNLEAECCLFYSASDFLLWQRLQGELTGDARQAAMATLKAMENYCTGVTCRHRELVRYFGQDLEGESCGACDACLSELDFVDEPLVIGQKILSNVIRLRQGFGAEYNALVLVGSRDQRIVESGHDELSTWGLLKEEGKPTVRGWIEQLVSQGFLQKAGDYNVLQVTAAGKSLLQGNVTPRLLRPAKKRAESKASKVSWDGVDRDLFETLKGLRREKAEEFGLPAFVIFSDASLRDMARRCPGNLKEFREVHGVGDKKCEEYGPEFLAAIETFQTNNAE